MSAFDVTVITSEELEWAEAYQRNEAVDMLNGLLDTGDNLPDANDLVQSLTGIDVLSFYDPYQPEFDITEVPGVGGQHREPRNAYGDSIYDVEGAAIQ
jgi:hypothetical protein